METCAPTSTTNAAPSRRPPPTAVVGVVGQARGRVEGEGRPEDRQQHRREQQRTGRREERDGEADQGGPDRERRLVGRSLVGECGVHEPALVRPGRAGQRPPPDAGQGTHLRQHQTGGCGAEHDGGVRGPAADDGDERREAGGAQQRLDEDDGTLPDPVGQRACDRGADGVGDGEGAGTEPAEAVAAGRGGDEEERAELAHGQREAPDERHEDVGGAGDRQESSVGGERGHEGSFGCVGTTRRTHLQGRVEPSAVPILGAVASGAESPPAGFRCTRLGTRLGAVAGNVGRAIARAGGGRPGAAGRCSGGGRLRSPPPGGPDARAGGVRRAGQAPAPPRRSGRHRLRAHPRRGADAHRPRREQPRGRKVRGTRSPVRRTRTRAAHVRAPRDGQRRGRRRSAAGRPATACWAC